MKFALLVCCSAEAFASMTPEEAEAFDRECLNDDEELERKGQLLLAQALEPAEKAVTVRVRKGKLSATDGPFAETKEQVGGIVFIEARDREEAIRIAATGPFARMGCVEVRPLMEASGRWPESAGGRRGVGGP